MPHTKKSNVKSRVADKDIEAKIPTGVSKKNELDLEGNEIFPVDKLDDVKAVEDVDALGDVVVAEETEEGEEMDEEEINPFKDKWEV